MDVLFCCILYYIFLQSMRMGEFNKYKYSRYMYVYFIITDINHKVTIDIYMSELT